MGNRIFGLRHGLEIRPWTWSIVLARILVADSGSKNDPRVIGFKIGTENRSTPRAAPHDELGRGVTLLLAMAGRLPDDIGAY